MRPATLSPSSRIEAASRSTAPGRAPAVDPVRRWTPPLKGFDPDLVELLITRGTGGIELRRATTITAIERAQNASTGSVKQTGQSRGHQVRPRRSRCQPPTRTLWPEPRYCGSRVGRTRRVGETTAAAKVAGRPIERPVIGATCWGPRPPPTPRWGQTSDPCSDCIEERSDSVEGRCPGRWAKPTRYHERDFH